MVDLDEVPSPPQPAEASPDLHLLQQTSGFFVSESHRSIATLGLSPDDRWTGDVSARVAGELVKAENPPTRILHACFDWFSHKADIFCEEAAKAAGKAVGTGVGIGIGVVVTGQLPRLIAAVSKLLEVTGT